jgi:hypothetical protein
MSDISTTQGEEPGFLGAETGVDVAWIAMTS